MIWEQQALKSKNELKIFIDNLHKNALMKVMNIKLATLWYRWTKTEAGIYDWEFNHLEDGHCQNNTPTPKYPHHVHVWKGGKWAKSHVQLNKDNVVKHYLIT